MTRATNIAWIAGIIEGEGCIMAKQYPATAGSAARREISLTIGMSDEDIMRRVHHILGPNSRFKEGVVRSGTRAGTARAEHRRMYYVGLNGPDLIAWLQTIYPFMGERRRGRIREAIKLFKERTKAPYYRRRGQPRFEFKARDLRGKRKKKVI